MNTSIVQFPGEDRKEAIVNHFSLDIVEKDSFLAYIKEMGYTINDDDSIIINLHQMWRKNIQP